MEPRLWPFLFRLALRYEVAVRLRQRLVERYGEERTFRMADTSRNLLLFPNLIINDAMAITTRYFEPIAPDEMR